jgi:hypothetical protein
MSFRGVLNTLNKKYFLKTAMELIFQKYLYSEFSSNILSCVTPDYNNQFMLINEMNYNHNNQILNNFI